MRARIYGGSIMAKYNVKKCGPERTFDHAEIKKLILEGMKNKEIAAEVGCTPGYVWEIRMRDERKKRLFCEGRVC